MKYRLIFEKDRGGFKSPEILGRLTVDLETARGLYPQLADYDGKSTRYIHPGEVSVHVFPITHTEMCRMLVNAEINLKKLAKHCQHFDYVKGAKSWDLAYTWIKDSDAFAYGNPGEKLNAEVSIFHAKFSVAQKDEAKAEHIICDLIEHIDAMRSLCKEIKTYGQINNSR